MENRYQRNHPLRLSGALWLFGSDRLTSKEPSPFRERDKPGEARVLSLINEPRSRSGSLTFHPRFSKKVHKRAWPVVLPPHGPARKKNIYYSSLRQSLVNYDKNGGISYQWQKKTKLLASLHSARLCGWRYEINVKSLISRRHRPETIFHLNQYDIIAHHRRRGKFASQSRGRRSLTATRD